MVKMAAVRQRRTKTRTSRVMRRSITVVDMPLLLLSRARRALPLARRLWRVVMAERWRGLVLVPIGEALGLMISKDENEGTAGKRARNGQKHKHKDTVATEGMDGDRLKE